MSTCTRARPNSGGALNAVNSVPSHTPPLGFALLTPFYDRAIELFTRERTWRTRLAERLGAQAGEIILDVGSGTGSLALLVTAAEPRCLYRGLDPDDAAVARARLKASGANSPASFTVGFLADTPATEAQRADKIVCSLVLHQVPFAEKKRLLTAMASWLKPGGHLFIADYGEQRSAVMRLAFRFTVQLLDGVADTKPNADGIIPELLVESGYGEVQLLDSFATPTGSIDILRATKEMEY